MKKMNRRWLRIVALCLGAVLLIGAVSASSSYTLDLSGDGKVNVWDLQLAVNGSKGSAHENAILTGILGNPDELHPNTDGVYEIHTVLGLCNMAKNAAKGYSFKLMADIDWGGADWTPVRFKGSFDGNGHTISNVTITKGVASTYGTTDDMGFFSMVDNYTVSGTTVQSEVRNLNLENVNITATDRAQFIGLLAGSNRGKIENCTTTGIITDTRTVLSEEVYVGTLTGRNNDSTPAGTTLSGTNLLTADDGAGNEITGLTSRMAMDFADLDGTTTYTRHIGIAGSSKAANIDTAMIWQDVTNDTSRLSETEQTRRQTVVDKMYQMGTVQWTPANTFTYTRHDSGVANTTHIHSDAYLEGVVYTGMPYVGGHNSSYERFMSMMAYQNSDGVYVTVDGLEDGARKDGLTLGASSYMGVNCSVAVGWAWASVTPTRVYNDEVTNIYGGAAIRSAYYFVPNEYNTGKYGTLPVGDYESPAFDSTKYTYGAASQDTQVIITTNGADEIAECYALAHKGDAITYAQYTYDATADLYNYKNSHIRLLAVDPVIIRDYKGVIDLEASYVLTHEQGDGLNDNKDANGKWLQTYTETDGTYANGTYNVKYTSWRINHKYTLSVLLTEDGYNAAKTAASEAMTNGTFVNGMQPGSGWGYVPVTMRGFTNNAPNKAPYYSEYSTNPVTLPNTGWYYSNYWTISGTMVITDADGNEVYNETKFLVDRALSTGFNTIKLEQDFPDADDNLVEGQTYRCTLSFLASNGKVTTKINNQEFVYTPVTGDGSGDGSTDTETDAD